MTKDGNRTAEKQRIAEEAYRELLTPMFHLEKKRYEFIYTQNGTSFAVKYDEFVDSDLRMLEVDASSENERRSFNPQEFPSRLEEVTGDSRFSGYQVAKTVGAS